MNHPTTRSPGEISFSIALLAGSVFLFWQAYAIAQFSSLSSPGALPMAAAAIMVISAGIAVTKTIKLPIEAELRFFRHLFPPVVGLVMAMILIFAVMLEPVGFVLSAACFLFLGISFLHRGNPWANALLSLLCLIAVYGVFRLVFQVVLPEGLLPEREWLAQISKWFS